MYMYSYFSSKDEDDVYKQKQNYNTMNKNNLK